jgi:hypothetical protein
VRVAGYKRPADRYEFGRRSVGAAVAAKYDRKENVRLEAASAQYFASEAVGRFADRAVQIHGGAGYMAAYKVERFCGDVRLLRIYEGASQIQQVIYCARNDAQCEVLREKPCVEPRSSVRFARPSASSAVRWLRCRRAISAL